MRGQVRAEASEVETPRPTATPQVDQFFLSRHPAVQFSERVDHGVSVAEVAAALTGVAHAAVRLHQGTVEGRMGPVATGAGDRVVLAVVVEGRTRTLRVVERSAEDPEGERVDIVGGISRPILVPAPGILAVCGALHGLESLEVLRGQVDDHGGTRAGYAGAPVDGLGYDLIGEEEGGKVVGDSVAVGHQGSRARSAGRTSPPHTYNITSCEDLATT
jgi:hypothetical protein